MNKHRLAGPLPDDGGEALIDGVWVEGWRAAIVLQSIENQPIPEEAHFVAESSGHSHGVEQGITVVLEEGGLPGRVQLHADRVRVWFFFGLLSLGGWPRLIMFAFGHGVLGKW